MDDGVSSREARHGNVAREEVELGYADPRVALVRVLQKEPYQKYALQRVVGCELTKSTMTTLGAIGPWLASATAN